jgi:hypothetical protein
VIVARGGSVGTSHQLRWSKPHSPCPGFGVKANLDFDEHGRRIGIEVLAASSKLPEYLLKSADRQVHVAERQVRLDAVHRGGCGSKLSGIRRLDEFLVVDGVKATHVFPDGRQSQQRPRRRLHRAVVSEEDDDQVLIRQGGKNLVGRCS